MSYWGEWKKKVDALEEELHALISDITKDHSKEIQVKFEEYDRLIAESIPY